MRLHDEALEYITGFDFFDQIGPSKTREFRHYLGVHLQRFLLTLDAIPRLPARPRALELGAFPYFLALLLRKYRACDVK